MSSDVPFNLLIAYPYFDEKNFALLKSVERNSFRLIIDSGAFTAYSTGKTIHLDDYCRFLDRLDFLRPFHAVQLDVIGSPEGTYKNLLTMKARGYDVMPVFTRGDSLERLEEFYGMTDYIMFGGIAVKDTNQNYVKWFLNKNKQRKTHWLGFVNMPFIKAYRPESVDSSSWRASSRFGELDLYEGFGKLFKVDRKEFMGKPNEKIIQAAQRVGIELSQLKMLAYKCCWSSPANFDGKDWSTPKPSMVEFISTLSHLMRARDVEKNLGTKLYQASPGGHITKMLFWARDYLKRQGLWK